MISVTSGAKSALEEVLQRAAAEDSDVALRLTPAPAPDDGMGKVQLGLVLDHAQEGDQVVEHNGKKVLVVAQPVSEQLDGATLDAVDTPDGRRLTIST